MTDVPQKMDESSSRTSLPFGPESGVCNKIWKNFLRIEKARLRNRPENFREGWQILSSQHGTQWEVRRMVRCLSTNLSGITQGGSSAKIHRLSSLRFSRRTVFVLNKWTSPRNGREVIRMCLHDEHGGSPNLVCWQITPYHMGIWGLPRVARRSSPLVESPWDDPPPNCCYPLRTELKQMQGAFAVFFSRPMIAMQNTFTRAKIDQKKPHCWSERREQATSFCLQMQKWLPTWLILNQNKTLRFFPPWSS